MKSYDREIIYCDNHLLVAVKYPGEIVQPDLQEELRQWVALRFDKLGRAFLEPIHRLDKPVSGLILFARTTKALQRLHAFLREGKIQKTYLARVEGFVQVEEASIEHFLRHGSFRAKVSNTKDKKAKRAALSYKVLERNQKSSLLRVEIHTGRYHQIRVQFAQIGHPICGDSKYGSKYQASRIALHHMQVRFKHPVTNEELTFFHCLSI